jgi:hypothetical protein
MIHKTKKRYYSGQLIVPEYMTCIRAWGNTHVNAVTATDNDKMSLTEFICAVYAFETYKILSKER